ncbi:MAG: stalk domain-containing protein, partial [Caldisericia bacterium]|nr:stalk domain-containing protein [Caldisericia bacterium]
KKFTGQIHVFPQDPNAPINARGKFIHEEQSVIVTWNPPTNKQDQIIGYNVYRSLHYPALANSAPFNETLLKDSEYIDQNFIYGQQYWYVVKAVYQDGSLSPASNTVQISIPPEKHGIVIVTVDKPVGSSYYLGSPLSINFQSSLSGKVSIICNSGFINVTLLETYVKKGTRYHWKPILPDLPEAKSMCTIHFEGDGGYTHTKKVSFFTVKQTKGASSIYGVLQNKPTKKPIEGAIVQVSSGPSYAISTTDENGTFLLKHLSPGSYQFAVNYNGDVFSPYHCNVEIGENTMDPIEIDTKGKSPLLVWNSSIEQQLLPLWLYAEEDDLVTLYWEKDQIQRVSHRHVEVKKNQTTFLRLPIVEDLPHGKMYLVVESEKHNHVVKLPIVIPKPQENSLYGTIKNMDGIPLQNATINEYPVNEWGYFKLSTNLDKITTLTVQAPYYETRTIDPSDFQPGTSILLEPQSGSIHYSQQEIFINKDFNTFSFQWVSQYGWTEIKDFQIVKESGEESEVIYSLSSLQCNPTTRYEFEYSNILRDQVEQDSLFLTWTTSSLVNNKNSIHKIPIKKGLDDKLFLSTHPSIPIFSNPSSMKMILDIYSYASRPEDFLLRSNLSDEFDSSIHPSELIPGNQCDMEIRLKEGKSLSAQLFVGSIEVISKTTKEIVEVLPIYFQIENPSSPSIVEPYWRQVLYRGSSVSHTFYFSETPDHISIGDIPAFMEYQLRENSVVVSIESVPEGTHEMDIPIVLNQHIETTFHIHLEGLPEPDHWNAPVLKASNTPEGILVEINNIVENNLYRLNKYQNEPLINWQNDFTEQDTFLDTDVQDTQSYHYQAFATNHRLESGWSNEIVQLYAHLFLDIKMPDITYTNKSSILLTGTVTPKATLQLNQKMIPVDNYGRFSFNAPLTEGRNSFVFTLEDSFNNTLSKEIFVIRDTIKPDIQFVHPKQFPYYTKKDQVEIQLKTEVEATVTINQFTFLENSAGNYIGTIPLIKGKNDLEIRIKDKASNETITSVECIRYEKAYFIQLRIGSSQALVNGQTISLDTPPQILQGRTVVPLRFISEAFGANVEWVAETKEITIQFYM